MSWVSNSFYFLCNIQPNWISRGTQQWKTFIFYNKCKGTGAYSEIVHILMRLAFTEWLRCLKKNKCIYKKVSECRMLMPHNTEWVYCHWTEITNKKYNIILCEFYHSICLALTICLIVHVFHFCVTYGDTKNTWLKKV